MDTKNKLRNNWLLFSISGLIVIGAGLSMAIEAGLSKVSGESWFLFGTTALIIFNSGVSLVGQGIIYKCRLERLQNRPNS